MENILQINVKLEDQAKINYSNARYQLTVEEEKLAVINNRKKSYENELRNLRRSKLNLLKMKECEEAIDVMDYLKKEQITLVKNARNRLEIARIRLTNAVKERKIQEKLKERAWEEYMLEYEAYEQKEIDQINSFKFHEPRLTKEGR